MALRAGKAIASLGLVSALTMGGAAVTQKAIAPIPTHAVRGVVKTISAFYVAIRTGSGKKAKEMTFVLRPETERDGEITIGATVSIRYRVEGKGRTLVATAVSAHTEKARSGNVGSGFNRPSTASGRPEPVEERIGPPEGGPHR